MRGSEFLDDVERRLRNLIDRARSIRDSTEPDNFNQRPDPNTWSPAEVFEHMMLANAKYLPVMADKVQAAPKENDGEVVHSWFGRQLIKASGPGGNAPAPKVLHPKPGPYGLELVSRWIAEHEAVIALTQQARGIDLSKVAVRNPFVPIFKMNLADCFEILTVHGERHIAQAEERLKAPQHTGAA